MKALKKQAALLIGGMAVIAAMAYVAMTPRAARAQDATYGTKVYMDSGGDRLNVVSGGSARVLSGGTLDVSAGTLTLGAGQIAAAALASDSAGLSKVTGGLAAVSSTKVAVTAGSVQVSTSPTSSASVCFAGAFQTLPTSGWNEGCIAYQLSDHVLYVATITVTMASSWKAAF